LKIVYGVSKLVKMGLFGEFIKYSGNGEWMVVTKKMQATKHGQYFERGAKIEGQYKAIHEWEGGGTLGIDESIHMEGTRIKIHQRVKIVIKPEEGDRETVLVLHSNGSIQKEE